MLARCCELNYDENWRPMDIVKEVSGLIERIVSYCTSLPSTKKRKYLIIYPRKGVGFFATFIQVLGELQFARENSYEPLVFFGEDWIYWSNSGYRDSRNGWEYYFEPVTTHKITTILNYDLGFLEKTKAFSFKPSQIFIDDFNKTSVITSPYDLPSNVFISNRWPEFHAGTSHFLEERRSTFNYLINQYIRVKPEVLKIVEEFEAGSFQKRRVIAVHKRGGERNDEIEGWHGKAHAGDQYYFQEIDKQLEAYPDSIVYLATDTTRAFDIFSKKYGDKLVSYNAKRSSGESAPHVEFGGPEVGDDILIETLLLSRSDFLIYGLSNIGFAALCMSPHLEYVDVYQEYADELTLKLKKRKANI